MDALQTAHANLVTTANLAHTLTAVDALISLLQSARSAHSAPAATTPRPLPKSLKASFEQIEESLKEVNKGLNQYQKALKAKFKTEALPDVNLSGHHTTTTATNHHHNNSDRDADGAEREEKEKKQEDGTGEEMKWDLAAGRRKGLVERAVGMHLLREGKFDVAGTFVREVREQAELRRASMRDGSVDADTEMGEGAESYTSWTDDFIAPPQPARDGEDDAMSTSAAADVDEDDDDETDSLYASPTTRELQRGHLQRRFAEMYRIITALRRDHDLAPAIAWAKRHREALEARGSNLEFELAKLKFAELYLAGNNSDNNDNNNNDRHHDGGGGDAAMTFAGPLAALQYALATFPTLAPRHQPALTSLAASLAFAPSLATSPYGPALLSPSAWAGVTKAFTADFTALLALPSAPPLTTTLLAGTLALPTLSKLSAVLATSGGQWNSTNELPVETPLPRSLVYHNIFVCPVSKEQANEENWPVMLPCGHVVARESMERLGVKGGQGAQGGRGKCAYCPVEFGRGEGRRVYI